MVDFIEYLGNVLAEQNKTIQELFDSGVVVPNTYFKYRHRYPSLSTIIKIANYLKVSLDYLLDSATENTYSNAYQYDASVFYNNLMRFVKSKNLSGRQFCAELNYSKDNLARWKNGVTPSVVNLVEIAKYFNCSIDDLLL